MAVEHQVLRERPSRVHWPQWLLFPSQEVSQHRKIERGLTSMIWVAMPFLFHLLSTYPGGFGRLTLQPNYFFVVIIDVIAVALVAYVGCLALAASLVRRGSETARADRKRVHRAWMVAVVSCFAAMAIFLSISTWIAMHWLQDPSNIVTTDVVSLLLGSTDGWRLWLSRYVQALIVAMVVSFAIRHLSHRLTATGATAPDDSNVSSAPNLLLAALAAYLFLMAVMFLTR